MDIRATYLTEKKEQLDQYMAFHRSRLQSVSANRDLKLYFYPVPKEIQLLQYNYFLLDTELFKEDHGSFSIMVDVLQEQFSTPDIGEADFVVFPFNLYFHHKSPLLKDLVADMRQRAGKKKIILFSISDFCRKPVARSTPVERQLFEKLDDRSGFFPAWADSQDIYIHFESTVDFVFNDVAVFPLIQQDPIDPLADTRNWLFSFVGEYYREGWPEGFVRSPSNRVAWENMIRKNNQRSLVLTAAAAKEMYPDNPYFTIPRKSVFTLCPRGISSWSFRVFEAILCGSIPVILSDAYRKPFAETIPWDYFSLTYPESYLENIGEVLAGIQPEIVQALSSRIRQYQHHFTAAGLINLISAKLQAKKNQRD